MNNRLAGHLSALMTILIWGTTFISTKILLQDFHPVEILFIRFFMGMLALLLVYPRRMSGTTVKQEGAFALAGLFGVTLYFLLENIALTYTLASNVGVIISVAPFFTAIFSFFLTGQERPGPGFFPGFAAAMAGIFLISFNGSTALHLNPAGDMLALLASVVWAGYSLVIRRIGGFGYPTIQTTRRIFFYGLVLMLPVLFFFPVSTDITRVFTPVNGLNLLFLGLGASALCFVTWNFAVGQLGAVRTSVYIYLVPVITIITSVIVLKEPVTPVAAAGASLTVLGLAISERKPHKERKAE